MRPLRVKPIDHQNGELGTVMHDHMMTVAACDLRGRGQLGG